MRYTIAEISQSALKNNLDIVKGLAPKAKVLTVIKANGYGHSISCVLEAFSAADRFAVCSIQEALIIRNEENKLKLLPKEIVLLEGFFHENELEIIVKEKFITVIHNSWQLKTLENFVANNSNKFHGQKLHEVWVKFDTGMARLGFSIRNISLIFFRLNRISHNKVVMTHFANADADANSQLENYNKEQINIINKYVVPVVRKETNTKISCANSAAIINHPEVHYDWVRPGIMLYGSNPTGKDLNLKQAMAFKAKVISLKKYKAGSYIGYGSSFKLKKDSLIAIISAGYADGYMRALSNKSHLMIEGMKADVIGRISMDMLACDCSDLDGKVKLNSTVILADDKITADYLAELAGTISYEFFCSISQRVNRIKVD